MKKKARIVKKRNVNIGFIVHVISFYKIGRKKLSELVNVKVCDSVKCEYRKTCKKYKKAKGKKNENKSNHSNRT